MNPLDLFSHSEAPDPARTIGEGNLMTVHDELAARRARHDTTEAVPDFKRWLLTRGKAWNTVRAYGPKLASWIDFAADRNILWYEFDPLQVCCWSQSLAPGRATRKQAAATIAAAAEWQGRDREAGEAVQCPRGMRKPKWRGIPREQVAALLDVASRDGQHGTAFMCALYLGMRVSEVVELRWEDVDLDRNRIIGHRDKVDDWHVLPLHPALAARLAPRAAAEGYLFPGRNGGHIATQTARDWLAAMCIEAGVPKVTPHQMRHTAAVALYEATSPRDPLVVQRFLGHANIQTTMTYLQTGVDAVADALSRVDWGQQWAA